MRAKIDCLCHAVSSVSGTQLHSSTYQKTVTIDGKSSLSSVSTGTYLCLGKPVYAKPELQIKSKAEPANLELRNLCNLDLSQRRITRFCRKINDSDSIQQNEEKIEKRIVAAVASSNLLSKTNSLLTETLNAIVGDTRNNYDEPDNDERSDAAQPVAAAKSTS